jgi:hypothetical protein
MGRGAQEGAIWGPKDLCSVLWRTLAPDSGYEQIAACHRRREFSNPVLEDLQPIASFGS